MFIQENAFEIVVCEMVASLSRPQCAKRKRILATNDTGQHGADIFVVTLQTQPVRSCQAT